MTADELDLEALHRQSQVEVVAALALLVLVLALLVALYLGYLPAQP